MTDINNINFQKNTNFIGNQNSVHRSGGIGQILYGLFSDKNKGVNGEIDEAVFQGSTGDCWLLSGVLSLSYTQEGKQAIKDAIKQDENGNYQVTFKGIDKTFHKKNLKAKMYQLYSAGLAKKANILRAMMICFFWNWRLKKQNLIKMWNFRQKTA